MENQKVSFSWRNYTKPTPKNLEAFAASLRRIIVVAAGASIISNNDTIAFIILVVGALLDEMKNFFAMAGHEYDEKVTINVPPAMTDKVEITEDVNQQKNETGN